MNIFSRLLPLRSLIRSTSVRSKEWYSIIKTVSFSSRSVSDPDPRSYVFLTSHSNMFSLVKDNHLLTHDSPECSIFQFTIGDTPRKAFVSSRRGLACLSDWWWDGDGYGIYLFNPFIRKYKKIALESSCYADLIREIKPNKTNPPEGDVIRIDFGYSEIEDDYKVLRMIIPKDKKKKTTRVEIYSLKSDKWKCVDFPTEIEMDVMALDVCVRGCLYWVIKNDDTRYLLRFDLKLQVFSKIELPKPYLELPQCSLLNRNDSLVILLHERLEDCVSGELKMCLLMFEEEKWKECSYTFSCDDIDWKTVLLFIPLGFTIDGRLILSVHRRTIDELLKLLKGRRRHKYSDSDSDSDSDDDCDNEKNILFAVDLDNDCALEKFRFNFSKHLINGATNILESHVLSSD